MKERQVKKRDKVKCNTPLSQPRLKIRHFSTLSIGARLDITRCGNLGDFEGPQYPMGPTLGEAEQYVAPIL